MPAIPDDERTDIERTTALVPESSEPEVRSPSEPEPPEPPEASELLEASEPEVRNRRTAILGSAAFWAIAAWVVGLPLAALAVRIIDANPLNARGSMIPVAAAVVGGVVVIALYLRKRSDAIVGLAAGAYAAWVGLTLTQSYHGTPFGSSGLRGDSARLAAMATKDTVHLLPVDSFVSSVPAEYPPLFPFVLARISNLIDRPAWSLIGHGEAVLVSAAVLVAFLMWRGLVPAPVALVLAVVPPWVFGEPRKSYEIVVLGVFLPWVLRAFAGLPRGRGGLRWWSAGIIGGLIVVTYQAPLLLGGLGIVAIIVVAWRRAERRRPYVLHLVGVAATAFVVSSWYIIPFVYATFHFGGKRVNDLFVPTSIVTDPVGIRFLISPFAGPSDLLSVVSVVGLVGLVWYWRTTWWARPIALVVAGLYAYEWLYMLVFIATGHTGYTQYTPRVTGVVLTSAGVLSICAAAPRLVERLHATWRTALPIAVTAVVLAVTAMAGIQNWMPWPPGLNDVARTSVTANLAAYAHAEPLPDGGKVRFPARALNVAWFPVQPIHDIVTATLGPNARPVTLSIDERLFAYYPWPGYLGVERLAANTWTHWDDRKAELQRLSKITDPAEFARASANTKYGEIDVFALRVRPAGYAWGDVIFAPTAFDSADWVVDPTLANNVVVAVRRPR
jgi:Arabinofuranosyltransferase A C terminal